MSRSVDLFIDHEEDPHQLLVLLGQAVHSPPIETTDGRWELQLGDELVAHLHEHPYLDDGDLHLSRYKWALSARVGHEGTLVDSHATVALRMVAEALRRHGVKVLLTLDLQNRIDLGPDPVSDDRVAASEDRVAASEDPDAGVDGTVAGAGQPSESASR